MMRSVHIAMPAAGRQRVRRAATSSRLSAMCARCGRCVIAPPEKVRTCHLRKPAVGPAILGSQQSDLPS